MSTAKDRINLTIMEAHLRRLADTCVKPEMSRDQKFANNDFCLLMGQAMVAEQVRKQGGSLEDFELSALAATLQVVAQGIRMRNGCGHTACIVKEVAQFSAGIAKTLLAVLDVEASVRTMQVGEETAPAQEGTLQ